MHLADLHVSTSRRSQELNPDLRSLAATQAKLTAASDLRHCATRAGGRSELCYVFKWTAWQASSGVVESQNLKANLAKASTLKAKEDI